MSDITVPFGGVPVSKLASPFVAKVDSVFVKALELLRNKNRDYATDSDPFLNFRGAESLGVGLDVGILLRLQDKFTRLCNIARRDGAVHVADETVKDTLLDMMNYCGILYVWYETKDQEIEWRPV